MKGNIMKHPLVMMVIAAPFGFQMAEARVTQDIRAKVSELLGHSPTVMNIHEADQQGLKRGQAKEQPWTGSFWPDITGNIANHYRRHKKTNTQIKFVFNYGTISPRVYNDFEDTKNNWSSWSKEEFNENLSPSEKYDLLIGNENFEFTKAIIEELEFRKDHRLTAKFKDGSEDDSDSDEGTDNQYFEETDDPFEAKVEHRYWRAKGKNLAFWSGICDGWGPAAVHLPRPVKSVTVMGASGKLITFYPDDIKALGSYLFARTNTPYFSTMNYKFAGKKCRDGSKKPDRRKGGLVEDPGCNDLDAGVFHAVLLNRLGKDKLGFVFDVDNNHKINNHPVASYEYTYFNPSSGDEGTLKNSVVDIKSVRDGYAHRRYNATQLVGVKVKIKYMDYVWPEENRDRVSDSIALDKVKEVEYEYDLELDAQGNILGGEWGNRAHDKKRKVKYANQPDFIWLAAPQALPYSEQSFYAIPGVQKNLSSSRPFNNMEWAWNGSSVMPQEWIDAARADQTWAAPELNVPNAVLKSAQPLSHIVYYLFDQARGYTSY